MQLTITITVDVVSEEQARMINHDMQAAVKNVASIYWADVKIEENIQP